ncbi:hypothetical protein LSUCC1028_03780 [Rhodobacterales bacterium LSUCC1028]|nr:hypothetical protein [Rhodobacterales bacterium LSUCC1028]
MSNPGEHINDEIDLIELLQNLWDGKWVIAGVSAAALAIGGAYVALTPNSFDASITIRPLDAATIDQFRTLNDAIVDARGTLGPSTNYISAPGALAEFTEVLLQRDTIVQAAGQNNMTAGQRGPDVTPEMALRYYAFDVDISPVDIPAPSITGSTSAVTAWQVTWGADDEAKSNGFIAEALRLTSEAARQRLTQRLTAEADQIRREQSRRAQQIETEIANAIEDYQVHLNDQIAYLSEQASLARVLGIEIGTGTGTGTGTINSNAPERSSSAAVSSALSYLDGYRALDEQITILSSREQVEAFVPGLRDLQAELRAVEQDRAADELVDAMEATPLSDAEAFRAAQYDLAAIEMTYHKKTSLILALSLVLGGFLGAIVVLIRNAVDARRANR